jgi:hypothetical protein
MFVQMDDDEEQGHWGVGFNVDTWQMAIAVRKVNPLTGEEWPDRIGSLRIHEVVRSGILKSCDVQIDTAIWPLWPTSAQYPDKINPTGIVTMFFGRMAEIDFSQSQVAFSINSLMSVFAQQMPRNVYQAGCRHTLYDVGCTLNKDNFKVSGEIEEGTTKSVIKSSVASPPGSGTLALGRIVMTSGKNAGNGRTVRAVTGSGSRSYQLMIPFYWPVEVGDTFDAYAGCDKTNTQCNLFGNKQNYGAERFIPSPETAI